MHREAIVAIAIRECQQAHILETFNFVHVNIHSFASISQTFFFSVGKPWNRCQDTVCD